jgi:hypothetical protein
VSGDVHAVHPSPSSWHSKVEPSSLELKVNVGVVSLDGLPGLVSIVVFGGPTSMIHVWLAGLPSVFPAGSVARTSNVWLLSASAGESVSGDVHGSHVPPSSLHSNVEPVSGELNVKVGVVLPEGLAGLESIVVFGAVVSIVQVDVAGDASVLPAASVARTSKVWLPSPSAGEIVSGLVHDDQLPPSTRHWKVEPGFEDANEKTGERSFEGSLGCELMVVSGADASTVHT